MSKKILLAVPVGADGCLSVATHRAIATTATSPHDVECTHSGSSALTHNFNSLWCEAVNRPEIEFFVMLHTDIAPEEGWLDKLIAIMEKTNADVVSAIMAIKDERGVTSTAFDTNRWAPRRLTMHEAMAAPPTFDGVWARANFGAELLLNTGLMAVRMGQSWNREVCFDISNVNHFDGERMVPFFEPEDWKFSRWANKKGLKLVATREIKAGHIGSAVYLNDSAWGRCFVDAGNLEASALAKLGKVPN